VQRGLGGGVDHFRRGNAQKRVDTVLSHAAGLRLTVVLNEFCAVLE
jgi:hypothetical protein